MFYPISAQTDGLISEMLVDEGVSVKKGDHLLTIDDRVAQVEVSVAKKEWELLRAKQGKQQTSSLRRKTSELADAEFSRQIGDVSQRCCGESQLKRQEMEARKLGSEFVCRKWSTRRKPR